MGMVISEVEVMIREFSNKNDLSSMSQAHRHVSRWS